MRTCLKWSCFPLLLASLVCLFVLVLLWFEYAGSHYVFPWDWDHPRAFPWECQQPPLKSLKSWFLGLSILGIFAVLFVTCLCYQALLETRTPRWAKLLKLPLSWKLVKAFYTLACIVWEVVGLYWVNQADEQCLRRQGRLLGAMQGFCWVGMVSIAVVYIGAAMGFIDFGLSVLPPRSSEHSSETRGVQREWVKEMMKRCTRPVSAASDATPGCFLCPICLGDLDDTLPIVATRKCGHAFHEQCICEWLKRDIIVATGRCPSCRQDLVKSRARPQARGARPQARVTSLVSV